MPKSSAITAKPAISSQTATICFFLPDIQAAASEPKPDNPGSGLCRQLHVTGSGVIRSRQYFDVCRFALTNKDYSLPNFISDENLRNFDLFRRQSVLMPQMQRAGPGATGTWRATMVPFEDASPRFCSKAPDFVQRQHAPEHSSVRPVCNAKTQGEDAVQMRAASRRS